MVAKTEKKLDLSIFYTESRCPLGKLRLENPEHQKLIEDAIATPTISHQAIARVLLDEWNISISPDTVNKHRSTPQRCACRNLPK